MIPWALVLEPNGRFQLSNQGHLFTQVAIEPAGDRQLAQTLGTQVSPGRADKSCEGPT